MSSNYNNPYSNSPYPNSAYPNSAYPNGAYPNNPYPNSAYPNNTTNTYNPPPNQNPYYNAYAQSPTLTQSNVLNQTYMWMTGGLCLTAIIALVVSGSGIFLALNPIVWFGLIIAELGLVIVISAAINRMSPAVATALFLAYAALNGVTLSFIFSMYTTTSITATFFVTAGMFGLISLYGYTTKRDLTGIGSIAIMALMGLILASIVNLFLPSSGLYWLITYAGVIIFVALTAYDTQKIKRWSQSVAPSDTVTIQRLGIIGALTLYLDFINLFLLLLRIMGRRQ
jgi:FtsH-binding integral membrane protein